MYFLLCFRGNSINLHTLRSSICGFSISACHFRLSEMNCWMGLLSSPGLIHIPPRCQKRLKKQWKMQKMTIWSIDVFQSCNLLTYFHQAQWHRLCIRSREHWQKKEKDSLKKIILMGNLKQPNTTFLSPPRSSCRSSSYLRLEDFWLISQKGALEFSRWLASIFFSLLGKNINAFGFINHSYYYIHYYTVLKCKSYRSR